MFNEFIRVLLSVAFVLSVICVLWYIVWKFVLEKNPLIREFFDLDQPLKQQKKTNSKSN